MNLFFSHHLQVPRLEGRFDASLRTSLNLRQRCSHVVACRSVRIRTPRLREARVRAFVAPGLRRNQQADLLRRSGGLRDDAALPLPVRHRRRDAAPRGGDQLCFFYSELERNFSNF